MVDDQQDDAIEVKFEGFDRTLAEHDRRLAGVERQRDADRQAVAAAVASLQPARTRPGASAVLLGVVAGITLAVVLLVRDRPSPDEP